MLNTPLYTHHHLNQGDRLLPVLAAHLLLVYIVQNLTISGHNNASSYACLSVDQRSSRCSSWCEHYNCSLIRVCEGVKLHGCLCVRKMAGASDTALSPSTPLMLLLLQALGPDARIIRLKSPRDLLSGWDDNTLKASFEVSCRSASLCVGLETEHEYPPACQPHVYVHARGMPFMQQLCTQVLF
jgi:hypothetical protein